VVGEEGGAYAATDGTSRSGDEWEAEEARGKIERFWGGRSHGARASSRPFFVCVSDAWASCCFAPASPPRKIFSLAPAPIF